MKAWISFLLLVDLGLHAQSTTHFVANIPLGGNPNQYGTGTFELNGSSLSYSIVFTTLPSLITDVVIAPVGAQVTRPVMWGMPSVSPVIFDLGHQYNTLIPNFPGTPPALPAWTGVLNNLGPTQITGLNNGGWQVVGTRATLTIPTPTYESVSGQILPVPEPTFLWLTALGFGISIWLASTRHSRCMRCENWPLGNTLPEFLFQHEDYFPVKKRQQDTAWAGVAQRIATANMGCAGEAVGSTHISSDKQPRSCLLTGVG